MFSFRLVPIAKIILHVQQEHIASTLATVLAINALNAILDINSNTNFNVQVRTLVAPLPYTASFLVLFAKHPDGGINWHRRELLMPPMLLTYSQPFTAMFFYSNIN